MVSLRTLPLIALLLSAAAPSRGAEIAIGVESQRDHFRYHFDNPSNFDTSFLVPHFFEQRYEADKQMLVVRARAGAWEFEAGVTPVRSAKGSDYDTFFQPSGDIIVHGTTTRVATRSWRAAQHVLIGGPWRLGVALSRDQMKFPTSFSTTTHTVPPSTTETLSTTRESTRSDVLEIRMGWTRSKALSTKWELRGDVDVAPVTVARLTTFLPDKYDRPVPFSAVGFAAIGRVAATWHSGRALLTLGGSSALGRSYRRRASFARNQNGLSVSIGYSGFVASHVVIIEGLATLTSINSSTR